MRRISRTRSLVLGAVAAAALAATGSGSAATAKTVNGTVGPGFTIGLTMQGKKVARLKAGTAYRFVIRDRSSIHLRVDARRLPGLLSCDYRGAGRRSRPSRHRRPLALLRHLLQQVPALTQKTGGHHGANARPPSPPSPRRTNARAAPRLTGSPQQPSRRRPAASSGRGAGARRVQARGHRCQRGGRIESPSTKRAAPATPSRPCATLSTKTRFGGPLVAQTSAGRLAQPCGARTPTRRKVPADDPVWR
jgi:hypothetical protein